MDPMASSDSEVKTCSKTCLKNYETLKKQCDELLVKLNESEFKAATYKRGLATLEDQIITYKKNEVIFSEEVAVLKREVGCKNYEINVLKSELEKVKQEKYDIDFKIEKFDKASKDLNQLLGSQITDKSKKGLGYNVVPPPHSLIYNRPNKLDLSYFGLDEFKEHEFKGYGPKNSKQESNVVCDKESDNSKENSDESLVEEQVSQDKSSFVKSSLNVDKETVFLVNKKVEFTKSKKHEKPVKKSVRQVNTARPKAVVNAVRMNRVNAVKASACLVWRPVKPNSASITLKRYDYVDARGRSRTATARTSATREVELTATIDGQENTITEASLRRHLKLDDNSGVTTLPNSEIFEQLALMRFIQIYLNKQRRLLQPHTRTYSTPVLTQKVFSNMKRVTKGYSREAIPLFASMIIASETSPSRITSSPSLSLQHTPFTAPSTLQPSNIHTTPVTKEAASMPYESPLQSVHSLGRDEGSLSHHELTVLCTNLSNKVTSLEAELAQTKQTYGTNLTKLIKKVKKLEQTVKTSQSRRRTRVVLFDEEEVSEELDLDVEISLVPPHDSEIQEKISNDTEVLLEEEETTELVEEPTKLVEDQGSGEKGEQEVTIADTALNTASVPISAASTTPEVSTVAANLVYIRRSAEKRKDKGKAIMIEDESVQKKSKKQLEQERLSHEEAIRLQEHVDEEERKRIAKDVEIAKQLQEEYDKAGKKEAVAEVDTPYVIDWNDPSIIRFHALQNRPRFVAKVRKNMLMYLKNQGGYKMKDFKGMSYDDIRPIFEKVWDQVHSFVPMDYEEEVQRLKRAGQDVEAEPVKRQRTKEVSELVQEQTTEEPKTDELSQEQLNQMVIIVPDEGINVEALQTKYPLIRWEVYSEDTMQFWKIIRVGNHTKVYQVFEDMLKNFDRDDLSNYGA
ncbi:hypothetical protein Tco_0940246 [Tanacetum coccineum]|uniref:Uncharacterized protein n=1 Tax=Tanacetum coccineum TaxID=301880 RepID=A0ABQ5DQ49_9ASTR